MAAGRRRFKLRLRDLIYLPLTLLALVGSAGAQQSEYPSFNPLPLIEGDKPADSRQFYDVRYYRIDLRVDTDQRRIAGTVLVRARALVDGLKRLVLDLRKSRNRVERVAWIQRFKRGDARISPGDELTFTHEKDQISAVLPRALSAGEMFMVAVTYSGNPSTVIFRRTPVDRKPWVGTSCQGPGAHTWWPCKSSWAHPEDKPDAVDMNLTVDKALVAAGPGRLWKTEERGDKLRIFRWRMDYPILTYSVSLAVSNYTVLSSEVKLPGLEKPVPLRYYVLPRDLEKAKKEFAIVPEMLRCFSKRFGPWPFSKAKFALVQTSYWGMEHSTLVAYGNGYPSVTGRPARGGKRYPGKFYYDYILIHEVAHEWWGNAVSARHWGHFWIHEGFGTYAEPLWLEHKYGKKAYLQKMHQLAQGTGRGSVFRPRHANSAQAYSGVIYYNGACVLHMLRGVMGDDAFFRALKSFHQDPRYLYKNASTENFRAICEKQHGADLKWFFDEWVYGSELPSISGTETHAGDRGVLTVEVVGGPTSFKMPYDIEVATAGRKTVQRHWIKQGVNRLSFKADGPITGVKLLGQDWILDIGTGRRRSSRGIRLGITFGEGDGVRVGRVVLGSNAARAGMKRGDQILQAGDKQIGSRSDLGKWLRGTRSGQKARFIIKRDGQRITLETRLR